MDICCILQKWRLLHDVSLGLNEDNVQHVNEVLHNQDHFLEFLLGTQGKGEMVGKGYEIFADTSFDVGEDIRVVVIFGDLYVFLSIVDDLFGEIVMQTREEMVGNNEPTAWLQNGLKLFYCWFYQLLLVLMQFFAIVQRIDHDR